MNLQNIQSSSATTSLKIVAEGTGTLSVPTTATTVTATATIAHSAGTDDLLWQAGGVLIDNATSVVSVPGIITPYSTFDGRTQVHATVDQSNLYITLTNSTSGSPQDGTTFNYSYRITVP